MAFDVTLATAGFPRVRDLVVLLASESLQLVDWQFCAGCDFVLAGAIPRGVYPSDLAVFIHSLGADVSFPIPFTFGRLTVDAGGLAPGDYSVFVVDGDFCGPGECEDLPYGSATVHVVPEPPAAALLLVCLAGAHALRSRRSHS